MTSLSPARAPPRQATSAIPIVFSVGGDPVEFGLVPALNQPGGNVTGVYQFTTGLEAKRLGLLHDMAPAATTIAALVDANYSSAEWISRTRRLASWNTALPGKTSSIATSTSEAASPISKSPIVFGRPSRTWLTQANEAVNASRMAIMSKSENIPDHSPVRVVTARMQFPARLGCTRCPQASRSSSRAALAAARPVCGGASNDAAKDRMQPSRRS